MNTPVRKGKVYLMGAGPGNPELLTVQAAQILKSAEVVLHDHLVAQEILDLIPAWTQVRNVGKRCGQAGISQEKLRWWKFTSPIPWRAKASKWCV